MTRDRRPYILAVLIGATAIKIALASVLGSSEDVRDYEIRAQAFLAGKDLLDPRNTPTFLLLGDYLIAAGSLLLSQNAKIPFTFAIKLPAILSDLGISLLLLRMPRAGPLGALLYMASPVTLLLSTYHAQVHTVGLYAVALALWFSDRGYPVLGGVALGVAASVRQHFATLIVPLAKRPGKLRIRAIAPFAITVLLLNLPLLFTTSNNPAQVLAPHWKYGAWGYSMLLLQGPRVAALFGLERLGEMLASLNHFLSEHGALAPGIWAVIFSAWAWSNPGKDPWNTALLFLSGIYVTSPGFGVQWLVWALPFFILVSPRGAVVYSVLAGAFILGSYWQWSLNAKYGVFSLTANLHFLSLGDLAGVFFVGVLGLATWIFSASTACRLIRA